MLPQRQVAAIAYHTQESVPSWRSSRRTTAPPFQELCAGRRSRSEARVDNATINPRSRNLSYSLPVPPDQGGLSRGIVRPGGRAVSVLNSRRGLEWRRGLVRAKPGLARPEGPARLLEENRARGSEAVSVCRLDTSTSTFDMAAERCRNRTPRTPWARARLQTLAAEAGGAIGLARAFSSEVDTGSREENAIKQRPRIFPRFEELRNCSSARPRAPSARPSRRSSCLARRCCRR
ncbi:hypothetical protein SAMN04515666_109208 [Bosea lupini]|uniref:Uncharacterized protein n=1 Tax=Bosea lupini TaxID=1036779 RepID=A0A1H7X9Q2_9HYPH|nr:hypothetical protein SAMN04515666_109208 [Bosea lupini]